MTRKRMADDDHHGDDLIHLVGGTRLRQQAAEAAAADDQFARDDGAPAVAQRQADAHLDAWDGPRQVDVANDAADCSRREAVVRSRRRGGSSERPSERKTARVWRRYRTASRRRPSD